MAKSPLSRDVFGDVGLLSGRVKRCRVCVGTCSSKPSYSRYLYGNVGLVSGDVRRFLLIVGTCSANSG